MTSIDVLKGPRLSVRIENIEGDAQVRDTVRGRSKKRREIRV